MKVELNARICIPYSLRADFKTGIRYESVEDSDSVTVWTIVGNNASEIALSDNSKAEIVKAIESAFVKAYSLEMEENGRNPIVDQGTELI